jgi:hypothetical protein
MVAMGPDAVALGILVPHVERRTLRAERGLSRSELGAHRWSLPAGGVLRSFQAPGVVAEWLNAAVLKTAERETVP